MFNAFLYAAAGVVAGFITGSLIRKGGERESGEADLQKLEGEKKNFRKEMEEKKAQLEEERRKMREKYESDAAKSARELEHKKHKMEERFKNLDRKADLMEKKEAELLSFRQEVETLSSKLSQKEKEVEEMRSREEEILQRISRYSPKQAREELMKRVEESAQEEARRNRQSIVENARRAAQREAVEIIAQAIQRNASEVTQDLTVSTVPIPDEEMKGRIIGREGRNIRALESATGVNFIIDDTPGLITLSSFDGVRREVARRALEILMKDGRIQPARIEEVVDRVKKNIQEQIKKDGENAAAEAGITGLHDELTSLLGKLQYRTSYGQNVLEHSLSVAHLAGIMAEELDIDSDFARRSGFLHDIGKAVDREMQGNHAAIGAKLVKKFGESQRVQNAIHAHHEETPPQTVEAILIQAADAISAARPGARRENVEFYIKRMENIESMARSFDGVSDAYCISAGREIRIIVEPEKVSDERASEIADACAQEIEKQIDYPGEIKVTVIRSFRNTAYAR